MPNKTFHVTASNLFERSSRNVRTHCVKLETGQFISWQFISCPLILRQVTAAAEWGLGLVLGFGLGLWLGSGWSEKISWGETSWGEMLWGEILPTLQISCKTVFEVFGVAALQQSITRQYLPHQKSDLILICDRVLLIRCTVQCNCRTHPGVCPLLIVHNSPSLCSY